MILPSPSGAEITPSVVYFEPDGSVLVGSAAIQASAADPDNGVRLVKRAMGTEFPLHVRGQDHTPESVSALILRHLSGAGAGKPEAERRAAGCQRGTGQEGASGHHRARVLRHQGTRGNAPGRA